MNRAERYTVSSAMSDDAHDIATLHIAVWRQTYADVMDADFLASLDVTEWRADWVRQLTENHDTRVLVARDTEETNRLVGFASAGPARDTPAQRPLELYVLNVDASSHGTGVAQRLLHGVLGTAPAYLWVVEGNERAIRFYQKFGFVLGEALKWDAHSKTNDVLMTRDAIVQ